MNTSQLIRWLVPKMRLIEKDRLPTYWEEPVFSFEGAVVSSASALLRKRISTSN